MKNWSHLYLERYKKTLNDYYLRCYDLASEVKEWLKAQKIKCDIKFVYADDHVNLESNFNNIWSYHAIPVIEGIVHDAWCDKVLELREYVTYMFVQDRLIISGTWAPRGSRRKGILIERPKLV